METTQWTEITRENTDWDSSGYARQRYIMDDTVALMDDTVATMDGYDYTKALRPLMPNTTWS
jgi:hypothetical protein